MGLAVALRGRGLVERLGMPAICLQLSIADSLALTYLRLLAAAAAVIPLAPRGLAGDLLATSRQCLG